MHDFLEKCKRVIAALYIAVVTLAFWLLCLFLLLLFILQVIAGIDGGQRGY